MKRLVNLLQFSIITEVQNVLDKEDIVWEWETDQILTPGQEFLQAVDLLFPQVQDREALHLEAVRFATGKGVRNGRTAQQFYRQFAGDPRFC